jgi:ActR/RegA family two-component response regulator
MAGFAAVLVSVIPVVKTILSDIETAIEAKKTGAAQSAAKQAGDATQAKATSADVKDKRSHDAASQLATTPQTEVDPIVWTRFRPSLDGVAG